MQDETDPEAAQKRWAHELATIIHQYASQATPIFPPGTIQILAGGTAGTNPAPASGRLT